MIDMTSCQYINSMLCENIKLRYLVLYTQYSIYKYLGCSTSNMLLSFFIEKKRIGGVEKRFFSARRRAFCIILLVILYLLFQAVFFLFSIAAYLSLASLYEFSWYLCQSTKKLYSSIYVFFSY